MPLDNFGFFWESENMGAFVLYNEERRTLEAIVQYINRYGYAPMLREIAEMVGVKSPATIHEHILALIQKGYLVKLGRFKRGFDLAPEHKKRELENIENTLDLPLFGFIAAGSPLEPHSDPHATFKVPTSMISSGRPGYALQVKGSSMKDDGIFEGDYVIVEYAETAKNGDIVIAFLVDTGLTTLKRFFKETDRIVLKPANSEMEPIYAKNVKIQGKVVGIVRQL